MASVLIAVGILAVVSNCPAAAQQVERSTLDNGLRVVINQDHTVPTVAISVYYDVGSRNEVKGRSGFAHLFEHMMFQGSANVGKGEHFSLIINRGGSANGTTSNDRTNYFETLPANELALGLWLEADRMRSLAITQENFENQRMTVMEERRQRIDNQPYIPSMLRINELAYGDYWPRQAGAGSRGYATGPIDVSGKGIHGPALSVKLVTKPYTAIDVHSIEIATTEAR